MKDFRLCLWMGIVLLAGSQSLFSQTKEEKEEQKAQQVKETIDSRHFTIDVNRALPMSGRAINLTSSYSLEISGDSVLSYLPYYGRAYSVPYDGGNGLRFEELFSEYESVYDKKGTAKIQFRTRTEDDSYTFNIQVYPNGSAAIDITPINKQGITFYGELTSRLH